MIEAATLWELVDRRAAATPDRVFLVDDDGRELTFAAFRDKAERVAAGLSSAGVGEDTVVAWQLPTWIEAALLVAALSRLGAVQSPLVPIYRLREVGFIIEQISPAIYIGTGTWHDFDYQGMVAELAPSLARIVVDRDAHPLPEADPGTLPPAPEALGAEDAPVRYVFYTSGTTADPKGARHTEVSVLRGALMNTTGVDLQEDDTSMMIFPFTHIGGAMILESVLQVGARIVLTDAFVPDRTAELIKRLGVTVAPGVSPIHQAFVDVNRARPDEKLFRTVRCYPSGGAGRPPRLFAEVRDELESRGVISGYGLTEAPLLTMGRAATDPDEKLEHTEGRPGPGVELKLMKADGSTAGPGEEGEIRAKGLQVMRGYFDSALDVDAFDEDGWFRTGDLGKVDADGYVTITGRLKDIIIRKGENVSAQEVENVLLSHPAVAEVAVIGLPDESTGERACAVVVLAEGASFTFDEMSEHAKVSGLMMQKIPEQLEIVDTLPRNNTGKVMKFVLKEQFG